MYFLNDDERKKLLKGYLPKSREQIIAEELRGWNWHQPPLEPVYEVNLPLYQVAGKYCPTGRDVYLNRVENRKSEANTAMKLGSMYHEFLVYILVRAKKLIYRYGSNTEIIFQELKEVLSEFTERTTVLQEKIPDVEERIEQLYNFEFYRITSRIQETLSRQPYIGEDSLVAQVVPIVLEQKLDGSFLGLSPNLSSDAYVFSEPMILDLKFGLRQNFHRLSTTGYALIMEAIYEYPINIGCIVYGQFKNERLYIQKDFHIINDELRQWFVEERDEKMRMVYNEIDPGISDSCYESCPYYSYCKS